MKYDAFEIPHLTIMAISKWLDSIHDKTKPWSQAIFVMVPNDQAVIVSDVGSNQSRKFSFQADISYEDVRHGQVS